MSAKPAFSLMSDPLSTLVRDDFSMAKVTPRGLGCATGRDEGGKGFRKVCGDSGRGFIPSYSPSPYTQTPHHPDGHNNAGAGIATQWWAISEDDR